MNKINYLKFNWLAFKINNDCLKSHINFIKGRVIDLGCGQAPYKEDILKVADECIGVDWENSYYKNSQVDVKADLTQRLAFDDEYANTVVSF